MNHLALNLALSTAIFWIAARIYLIPRLGQLEPRAVLVPILLLHAMRHLGLMFLAQGVVHPNIPAAFAYPAAIGDLVAAVLALLCLGALVRRWSAAVVLLWIFNVEGFVDLLVAITLATIHDAGKFMGAAYWIPAFWVPTLLVTHVLVFLILLRHRGRM